MKFFFLILTEKNEFCSLRLDSESGVCEKRGVWGRNPVRTKQFYKMPQKRILFEIFNFLIRFDRHKIIHYFLKKIFLKKIFSIDKLIYGHFNAYFFMETFLNGETSRQKGNSIRKVIEKCS